MSGFLDRLGKIVDGLGNSAANYSGFVLDNVRNMWGDTDDDGLDGFLDHLYNVFVGAQASSSPIVANTPQGSAQLRRLEAAGAASARSRPGGFTDGFEDLAAVIPEQARSAVKTLTSGAVNVVAKPVGTAIDLANRAYEDVVDRPLSFLMTAGSLYDSPEFMKSLEGLSYTDRAKAVAREAWGVSEDRSFGESFAFAAMTDDITSQEEIDEAFGSDWFRTTAFLADITPAVIADPVGIAAMGVKGVRAGRVLGDTKNFVRGYESTRANNLYEKVASSRNVAEVREKLFSSRNTLEGNAWSTALHDAAKTGKTEFDLMLRGLLGNKESIGLLSQRHADLAYKLGYLTESRNAAQYKWYGRVTSMVDDIGSGAAKQGAVGVGSDFNKAYYNRLDAAVTETNSEAARLERTLRTAGTLDVIPKVSAASQKRTLFTRTEFYQQSPLAAPLRTVFGFEPQHTLSVHADDIDVHLDRFMRQAGVGTAEREAIRGQAIEAYAGGQAAGAAWTAQNVVIDTIAAKHGIDPELIREARRQGLKETETVLNGAKYDANTQNTVFKFIDDEGVEQIRYLPVAPEQLRNYVYLPDVKQLDGIAKRLAGDWTAADANREMLDWRLSQFNRVWKPAALLSVRWPMRVVGEEQLRAVSKVGAWALAKAHTKTAAGAFAHRVETARDIATHQRPLRDLPKVVTEGIGMGADYVSSPVVIGGEVFAPSLMERGGRAVEARLLDETAQFNRMYGQEEVGLRNGMYKSTQDWVELRPGDTRYYEAWEHAANNQLGRNRLARRLMEKADPDGLDIDDAIEWLKHDPEGIRFAQTMPIRSRNPEAWVHTVADQLVRYLPDADLQRAALNGEFTADLAKGILPDQNLQPFIHGQHLDQVIGGGATDVAETLGRFVDTAMSKLMTTPTLRLSRQPVFDALYRRKLTELVERAADTGLEITDVRRANFERAARRHALGETRELLYDMAEHSNLSEAFRFVAPFVDASREVITRWAGITVDNPLFVRRVQQLWQAPEKAGFVYDSLGRQVQPDGKVIALNGRRVDPEGDRYVRFVAPEWARDIPVVGEVIRGGIQFNKESMNTILANPFGAGPLVQVAVAQLVKPSPETEEALKWLFPYGINKNPVSALLPTTVKEIAKGDNDTARAAVTMHIWNDLATTYELNGRVGTKPTIEQAKEIESRIHDMLSVPSKFLSPVGLQTISPYQPYIDYLRQLQAADPATAKQTFYDEMGVEFAALANSLSQSNDKIPPTIVAYRQRAKFAELVEQFPDLGGLIVGDLDGKFSNAVYQDQLRKAIGPNNSTKQRSRVTTDEFVRKPNIEVGWHEFSKAMDALDAMRIKRGLPNLRVKAAEDLASAKAQIVEALHARYPEWYDEYLSSDPARSAKKIEGLRAVANDPRLSAQREEIGLLGTYLQARDLIQKQLQARVAAKGSGVLDATSNRDLALAWSTITSTLVESNLMFSQLFHRYLDNDTPSGLKNAA